MNDYGKGKGRTIRTMRRSGDLPSNGLPGLNNNSTPLGAVPGKLAGAAKSGVGSALGAIGLKRKKRMAPTAR